MNILERLDDIEKRMQDIETAHEFKYSKKKRHIKNQDLTKLKEIVGI